MGEIVSRVGASQAPPQADGVMLMLGRFVFSLATVPYQNFKRTTGYQWPEQDRVGRQPALQYTGPTVEAITLAGTLYPPLTGGRGAIQDLRDAGGARRAADAGGRPGIRARALGGGKDRRNRHPVFPGRPGPPHRFQTCVEAVRGRHIMILYRSIQGDVLDLICWHYYGTEAFVPQVLEANPALVELGPFLPTGTLVTLPDLTPPAPTRIQLWD